MAQKIHSVDAPSLHSRDLVVITTVSCWDEPPRIRHQVASALSKHFTVMFVETPNDWRRVRQERLEQVDDTLYRYVVDAPFALPIKGLTLAPFLGIFHKRRVASKIAKIVKESGAQKSYLINFNYDADEIMRLPVFERALYFCNDDFGSIEENRWVARYISSQEGRVAKAADFCLAVSRSLVEKIGRSNKQTALFLPGHQEQDHTPSPPRLAPGGVIKVGYVGYINRRLAFSWIEAALATGRIEFHFAGPVESDEVARWLEERQGRGVIVNTSLFGDDLTRFLRSMDALAAPYVLAGGNMATTAPNKLFTYLMAGKPVIISAFPGLIDLGDGVLYPVDSPAGFTEAIEMAVKDDSVEKRRRRIAIAARYHWDIKGEKLALALKEGWGRVNDFSDE